MKAYHDIFDLLGVKDTIKHEEVIDGMYHMIEKKEFDSMMEFVKGKKTEEAQAFLQ